MEIKRYVVEYANDEKDTAKKWMPEEKSPIYCEYIDHIIKNYKMGYYTTCDAIRLIYNACSYLQSNNWKYYFL